jgi:hypothetical protein
MTAAHKEALAQGRTESRVVRAYLEALEAHKPKRGRKRTPDSIERRLQAIDAELEAADPLSRVRLTQERMNLQDELTMLESGNDLGELEAQFVEVAASYSERQGISYAAWREIGVAPGVLRSAGVSR